jgi:Lar family restriction alleviation protein
MSSMTTTNQRAVELAPCPFCGSSDIIQGTDDFGWHQVFCNQCCGTMEDDIPDKAIAAWNRRAPGWRPISEALRDGTVVFFHVPGNKNPLYGRADDYWHGLDALKNATHFHELPLPPPPGEG